MNFKAYIIFLSLILLSGISQEESYKVPDYFGEVMHYNVRYGILNIGRATISFTDDSLGRGHHIKAEAKSVGIVRFFKSINYCFECCMDTITGLPINASMSLADRRCRVYNETTFDHHSREDSSIVYCQMSGMHVVPKNIYDLLTAYFYFRQNHIPITVKTGQDAVMKIYIADILWDLRLKYVGRETIKTMYGKIECLKFIPSTVAGNFFKNDDDMTVWFTDDTAHIPVRLRMNLIVGAVNGDLVEYQKPN
ncbi:MAG: DUF3108 domain-containing protein [Bacteroidales bacterium]|nr:DUF3108 domain-containing protein [Bacteroidales bacterium]